MAPSTVAAVAALFFLQLASAAPSSIVVSNATPNRVFGGNETSIVSGQIFFDGGSVLTGGNTITCSNDLTFPTGTTTTQTTVYGTNTTSTTASNPAPFSVTISTSYVPAGATLAQPVDSNAYEVFCRAGGPGTAPGAGVTSATSANLAVNPRNQVGTPYFISSSIDKTTVMSLAGTASTATITGTFTKPGNPTSLICQRVGPPGNYLAPEPTFTYTVGGVPQNGGAATTTGVLLGTPAIGNPTTYSVSVNFNGVTAGLNTIRCQLQDNAAGGFRYGASAFSVLIMPPQVARFGPLAVDFQTIRAPASPSSIPGWIVSGSVEFADNTTTPREIFCASTGTTPPILIGQGVTQTLSTQTRKDVDFSVEIGDFSSAAPADTATGDVSATNAATCVAAANGGTTCTFRIGNTSPSTTSATPTTYTTPINNYGIQCFSGKIVTNTPAPGDPAAPARLIDALSLAALRVNPSGVVVPTADVGLTATTGSDIDFNLVASTTAPTVSTTSTTANSAILVSGQTKGITSGTRTVLCKTAFSSPSQFSAGGSVVVPTGAGTQQYSVSVPVPGDASSGLYSFRCLLNPADGSPPPFIAVSDRSVNVTIVGLPQSPTSAPSAPTPTTPTPPTVLPTVAPTTTRTPTRPPNPTPFPTKPRTPRPIPFQCSKDDEYRAPGACRKCISSESPFKQVFGGSVCVNPTTFSSKSTTCSTYTLKAFPRKDGTDDKTAGCISQKSQTISLLLVASPQSEVDFLSSASYRKTSLRLGTLRARSNRGLVIWVKKGKRQLVQFDDRFRTVRSQKGKSVKLTGTLRPYVGATLLRCFTAYLKVCDK